MITTFVEVRQTIEVTIDETKFTPQFMADFRGSFFAFYSLKDHVEHLAQLAAREVVHDGSFIEGYGPAKEMGISFAEGGIEMEVQASNEELARLNVEHGGAAA
ncbi:hypothetical protein [Methylosinus sp. KRF6]|uniref:hypothetical protein n=1 Tax=Methylosinus sp. KRF6 TaxID=2846853 RepID=UPI001C0AA8C6|nr:hypothetical protein [Methylosinus sp. KRF6]MBU3887117.1 hypothetical protein [Methylosinus sp. KRF6]